MNERTPIACSLTTEEMPARARSMEELAERLVALETRGTWATLEFEPGAAAHLADFVREESDCCPFFEFDLDTEPAVARLGVGVPDDGVPALRGLIAGFLGEWGPGRAT
jgi:hypothetical protein